MTQDEFPDDLIRHCEQQALEAVASDTADLVRAVLRASGYAKLVARVAELEKSRDYQKDRAIKAKASRAAMGGGIKVKDAQNAELVAALEELRERIVQGKGNVGHVALIDAALAAAGHKRESGK